MTTDRKPSKPLHPLGAVGLVALAAGLLAWLWLGEWRWAVTGLVLLVALAAVGAALDGRKPLHSEENR